MGRRGLYITPYFPIHPGVSLFIGAHTQAERWLSQRKMQRGESARLTRTYTQTYTAYLPSYLPTYRIRNNQVGSPSKLPQESNERSPKGKGKGEGEKPSQFSPVLLLPNDHFLNSEGLRHRKRRKDLKLEVSVLFWFFSFFLSFGKQEAEPTAKGRETKVTRGGGSPFSIKN